MKKFKILIGSFVTAATLLSAAPVAAHAEWKQNNTGWWYSLGSSYSTSWAKINGQWYYFDPNGYMKIGWVKDGGNWYYLNSDGAMSHDTTIEGYHLNSSGMMDDEMDKSMQGMDMMN